MEPCIEPRLLIHGQARAERRAQIALLGLEAHLHVLIEPFETLAPLAQQPIELHPLLRRQLQLVEQLVDGLSGSERRRPSTRASSRPARSATRATTGSTPLSWRS